MAAGDLNGDGFADIVVGADAGGLPEVKAFSGQSGAVLYDFYAYTAAFSGGVRVAVGDLTGDGFADLITAAGPGGAPSEGLRAHAYRCRTILSIASPSPVASSWRRAISTATARRT